MKEDLFETMHSDPEGHNMLADLYQAKSPAGSYHHSMHADSDKKATHSEIEKRRRQKMNKYLNELLHCLPSGSSKSKKLDKISILKTAVNHMKNLKASSSILSDSFICQNYISANELQTLILKDSEDFLIVIKCDSGKILYISDSCQKSIGNTSGDLTDKVFFELVHPSDTKQVKDQLVYSDKNSSSPAGQNLVFNQYRNLNTGVRRSFHCRIKLGFNNSPTSSENESREVMMGTKKPEYKVINFNGYLRSDALKNLSKGSLLSPNESSKLAPSRGQASKAAMSDSSNQITQYLIAYGHSKHRATPLVNFEFISRLDVDGKFIYVEPGVNLLLGYLPHQLMSESIFNHAHPDDAQMLRKTFQDALNNPQQKIQTQMYRLKLENNVRADSYTNVETVFYALSNPSSCQLEYVLAQTKLSNLLDISSTALGVLSMNRTNSNSISLPMTPSPEEISYANSEVLSEKASPSKANASVGHPNNAPKANKTQPINQQEAGNYYTSNSMADSRTSAAQTNDYYTGAGQLQPSPYDASRRKSSDYAQPIKHTSSFSNSNSSSSNSYEYVQHEHAYSNVGSSNSSQQAQYANYDGYSNQMQQQGTSFSSQSQLPYMPFDDSAYGDSTPNSFNNNNNSNK